MKTIVLRRTITDEIVKAMGYSPESWVRRVIGPVFWFPAQRFASLAGDFDEDVALFGLKQASTSLLNRYVERVCVYGGVNTPATGPLMVVSNHPGTFDGFVIIANLARDDLKLVASGVPFTEALPATSQYLIYAPGNVHVRMQAVRSMIGLLEKGEAVLIFPSGKVDPDPAVLPGAEQAITIWSRSLEIVLKRVPQTLVLPVIVSGVMDPSNLRNPIVRMVEEPWKQRRLAEYLQVMKLLITQKPFNLSPSITFGEPFSADSMEVIIAQQTALLSKHKMNIQG